MTPARPLAASVAALGIAGVVGVPTPATAAPAPCERAERYAAQSGAEMFRLNRLTLSPASDDGDPQPTADPSPGARPTGNDGGRPSGGVRAGGGPPAEAAGGNSSVGGGATSEQDGRAVRSSAARSGGETTRTAEAGRSGAARGGKTGTGAAGGGSGSGVTGALNGPAGAGSQPGTGTGAGGAASASDTDVPPGGRTVSDVRVGEAKSALVAEAQPNSAAVARMVNGTASTALNEPLVQQAPPTNPEPARRDTPAVEAGPLTMDAGTLTSHAQWAPGMACGVTRGKATRAVATLRAGRIMGVGGDVLVAVPETVESVSTTALERRGEGARTVAAATVGTRAFELLNGAVTVKVVRQPTLETRMSAVDGGEVSYVPATLQVSGAGIEPATLDTAGDEVEFTVRGSRRARTESGGVPDMAALGTAAPLTLPSIPGLPAVGAAGPESAPAAGSGTRVRIALGEVRQATFGHAIAARAGAIQVAITESAGNGDGATTALDLEIGVLESAAVAPEPRGGGVSGAGGGPAGVSGAGGGPAGVSGAGGGPADVSGAGGGPAGVSGAGGGLPLTGPRVDLLAIGGAVLLALGAAAMVFGVRRRRFRA